MIALVMGPLNACGAGKICEFQQIIGHILKMVGYPTDTASIES